jgi:hypothetical protein
MSQSWDRLEPNTTDETLIEGLQARVADPLWMLARQWQTGEFDGEDAATPVRAELQAESLPLTTLVTADGRRKRIVDNPVPLEALVEAIPPTAHSAEDIASLCAAALQLLEEGGADSAALLELLREIYPIDPARYRPDHPLPLTAERRLRVLARRCFDPFALMRDKGQRLRAKQKGIDQWIKQVLRLIGARGRDIAAQGSAWEETLLGYGASVSSRSGSTAVELAVSDYPGGRLDWYSFDRMAPEADTPRPTPGKLRKINASTLPLPLTYAGQPVQRFWEFEDGEVHFGAISAGPADIARMIVADFAAIGGDDMFVFPLEAEVGSLIRITRLSVRDTFGQRHTVPNADNHDRQHLNGKEPPFSLFSMGGEGEVTGNASAWLPILPVTANVMNGKVLERVALRRDEEANLAWAIEEEIEGSFGRAMRRRQAWEINEPPPGSDESPWPYRLQSSVPPWWIPLVPERVGKGGEVHLRRARLGAWETMPRETTGPKSRLMDPTRSVTLAEAALPASGLRITRHWQLARGYDGRLVLWQSWRRTAGAEDRASGLVYDAIDRKW